MALALRNARPLKPEIRLAQALSEFEAILQDGEKAEFRLKRSGRPPGVSDVMEVTALIDRNNRSRYSRRCFGPRFTNVLESVQQFSTVVDVIIGGSQSLIASAIWGTLKMTLQITASFASYFDNLSALFMRVGRACPRYQEYGVLYLKSARLQKALCEYFCTMVELCKRAVLFIRKPLITQLTASIMAPFRTEFGKVEADLNELALAIRDEASLASLQELSLENKEHAGFRAFFSAKTNQDIQAARAIRAQKRKFRFLDSCSVYDHQTAWKRARKAGTSSWIIANEKYQQWLREPISSVLWCTGILGSGKTILTASLVQEIIIKQSGSPVAFFFCNYDEAESLKTRTIVGSLVRQLLQATESEAFDTADTTDTTDADAIVQLDEDELVARALQMLPVQQQCFIVVDGLDECTNHELNGLFVCFERLLQSKHRFQVFCSSRPDMDHQYRFRLQVKHLVTLPNVMPEVSQYIENELAHRLEIGNLSLGDPTIAVAIQDALLEGCKGMFLWVVFQLDAICTETTDEAILCALNSLPKDLPETFDRLLRKSHQRTNVSPDLCRKIFALVAAARRPLKAEGLREAISIEPGETTWDSRKLVNDVRKALGGCGSLLVVDEESSAVHFTHHSVKQYLLSASQDPVIGRYHVDLAESDLLMGQICVTYLNLGIFDIQLVRSDDRKNLQSMDVTNTVIKEALTPSAGNKLALMLLKSKRRPDFNLELYLRTVASQTEAFKWQAPEIHAFFAYAQQFWLFHSRDWERDDAGLYQLFMRLVGGSVNSVTLPWGSESWLSLSDKFLSTIIEMEHKPLLYEVVDSLYHQGIMFELQLPDNLFYTLMKNLRQLDKETETGFRELVSRRPGSKRYSAKQFRALAIATRLEPEKIASFLLEKTTNINARDSHGDTSLSLFIRDGNIEMLKMMLTHPDVDVHAKDSSGMSPLLLCVERGDVLALEILLGLDSIDINERDDRGRTALLISAEWAHLSIMKTLLAHKDIDVNAEDYQGRTVLILCVENWNMNRILQRLLMRMGDNVNAKDKAGITPLIRATRAQHIRVVRLNLSEMAERLLQRPDIKTNERDASRRNALETAVAQGTGEIVRLLLSRKDAHVDWEIIGAMVSSYRNIGSRCAEALQMLVAWDNRNRGIVREASRTALRNALLTNNFPMLDDLRPGNDYDPTLRDANGGTALHEAVRIGRVDVVKLLLARDDVDVNLRDSWGKPPLYYAVILSQFNEAGEVEALLTRDDIDPDLEVHEGLSAFEVALRRGSLRARALLRSHKARHLVRKYVAGLKLKQND